MPLADIPSAAVEFDHVCVRKGNRVIIDDLCAHVPAGGTTVLVGPNGAGKTTLLHCLIGDESYSGRIKAADHARTAYVPQQLHIDRSLPLTVCEFLAIALQKRPLWLGINAAAHARARQLLHLVDAERLAGSRLGELSGGETRRVLLAFALARKPELLVLDEPEAGVDLQGERLFWEILKKTRDECGFTLLMVSHNLALAAHYASHVICLNRAALAEGPPHSTLTASLLLELFGVPIHLYPDQCGETIDVCAQCGARHQGRERGIGAAAD